jgi:hypothetical protein
MTDGVNMDFAHFGGERSWIDLRARLDRAAAALNEAGIRATVTGEGDLVGLVLPDNPEHAPVVRALRNVGIHDMANHIEAAARRRDG